MTDKADELPVLPKEITTVRIAALEGELALAQCHLRDLEAVALAERSRNVAYREINQQLKAELAAAKAQIAAYREELEDVRDDLDDNPDAYALIGIRARIGATLGVFES